MADYDADSDHDVTQPAAAPKSGADGAAPHPSERETIDAPEPSEPPTNPAPPPVVVRAGDAALGLGPAEPLARERLLRDCERTLHDGVRHPVIGRIVLIERIGKGGMGVVFLGLNKRLGTEVAVKVLPRGDSADDEVTADVADRFVREARLAARITSPHLVVVHDVDEDEKSGLRYFVMEYVRGKTAGAWARERPGAVPELEALTVTLAATRGLAAAHAAGIVHRDTKPDNILIPSDATGAPRLAAAKLADLGLARGGDSENTLTGTGVAMGTPGFMAPEQVTDARGVGPAADVFGIGATLYALLAGSSPFHGSSAADALLRTVSGNCRPLGEVRPDVTAETAALVARCLSTDPAKRPADALELVALLEQRMHEIAPPRAEMSGPRAIPSASAAAPPPRPAGTAPARRSPAVVAIAALLVVAAAVVAGMQLLGRGADGAEGHVHPVLPDAGAPLAKLDPPVTLRVRGEDFYGYDTLRTAALRTALAETGVVLDYANYTSHSAAADDLDRGAADVILVPLPALVRRTAKGRIVGIVDHTAGADAVVVNSQRYPQIDSPAAMKAFLDSRADGAQPGIAFVEDSPADFLAYVLDAKGIGFSLSRFRHVPAATVEEAVALLDAPEKDVVAAVVWEPYVTQAARRGHRVLFSSADVPETIVDVIFASEAALRDRREAVRRFIVAYYARMDAYTVWPEELLHDLPRTAGLSEADHRAMLGGLRFLGATEAARWCDDGTLRDRVDATTMLLRMRGRLTSAGPDSASLVESAFVTEAAARSAALAAQFRRTDPALATKLETSRPGALGK